MQNDRIISYDDGIVSEINGNNFELIINESSFSNELYTTDYIRSVFKSLESGCLNCIATIEQANEYFQRINETEGIPQPDLIAFAVDFIGTIGSNGMVVTKDLNGRLNVHSDATLVGTNVTGTISNGTDIKIIGEENGMYKIEYGDGKTGYVSKDYIKENGSITVGDSVDTSSVLNAESNNTNEVPAATISDTSSFDVSSSEPIVGNVVTNNPNGHLNVHSTNDFESNSVIEMIDNGSEIKILGEDDKMYKIAYGKDFKNFGYVSKNYIQKK